MFGRLVRQWRIGRRLRRRREIAIGPGVLEFTDDELIRRLGDGRLTWRIRWADVRQVVAFKQDLFAYDRMWLSFRRGDYAPQWVECHDEDKGWEDLCFKELPRRFPGLTENWWSAVAFPAFAANYTTVWGQPAGPDDGESQHVRG